VGDEEHEGIMERAADGYREFGENLENFETHAHEAVAHGVVAGAEAFGYAATLERETEGPSGVKRPENLGQASYSLQVSKTCSRGGFTTCVCSMRMPANS
jgi:hypothetical protein